MPAPGPELQVQQRALGAPPGHMGAPAAPTAPAAPATANPIANAQHALAAMAPPQQAQPQQQHHALNADQFGKVASRAKSIFGGGGEAGAAGGEAGAAGGAEAAGAGAELAEAAVALL